MVEEERKVTLTHWILIVVSSVIVLALGLYIVLRIVDQDLPVGRYFTIFFSVLGILGLIAFVLFLVIRSLTQKRDKEFFKEAVSTKKALEIIRAAVVEDTNIPHVKKYWDDAKNPPVETMNPRAVEFHNETTFTDPSGQTADKFLAVEMIVREGRRRGIHAIVVRIDQGEEWLRNNWNMRVRDHTPMGWFKLESGRYPLASAKDFQERAISRRIELAEEGWSESELRQMIDPYVQTKPQSQLQSAAYQQPEPIRTPSIVVQNELANQDDEDDGDINEDIQAYRRRGGI